MRIRKLIIELKTDAEVPLGELKRDLETEINCASYFYFTDEMKIREKECEEECENEDWYTELDDPKF